MDDTTELCICELEPHERYLPAARLFAGSVARVWGAPEGDVADLRIGASELMAASIAGGAELVTITMERRVEHLRLTVAPLDEEAMVAGDEPAADIVRGLFDDVTVDRGGVSVRTDRRR